MLRMTMATPNHNTRRSGVKKDDNGGIRNRTLFTGDNLYIMRSIPDACIDMIGGLVVFNDDDGASAPGAAIDRIKADDESRVMVSLEVYRAELQAERGRQSEVKEKYGVVSLKQSINDLDNDLIDLMNCWQAGEDMDLAMRNKTGVCAQV